MFGVSSFDTIVFEAIVFAAIVFAARWNSLIGFHSLSELSGLVLPTEFGGISKIVDPGKFRQLKVFSFLDTDRVVTTLLNSWFEFRHIQAFPSGSRTNYAKM